MPLLDVGCRTIEMFSMNVSRFASEKPVSNQSLTVYLDWIPARPAEVVDLKDEMVLNSFKPLNCKAFISRPSYSCQVVIAAGLNTKH